MYTKGDNMDLIIDFYKELDTLNLIIFWGIIIVIILLLIFSFILINKNKKLRKIVEQNNKYEEEIPIKKQIEVEKNIENKEEQTKIETSLEEKDKDTKKEIESNSLEIENNFVVEEHIVGYNADTNNISNIIPEETKADNKKYEFASHRTIEIPNKPYQRNVLREMSLSQTSPIGINRQVQTEERKTEMIKDLEETLNNEKFTNQEKKEPINELKQNNIDITDKQIKQELNNIENNSHRKTEIISREKENNQKMISEDIKIPEIKSETNEVERSTKEMLDSKQEINEEKTKSSSEQYLEEVSRKLAEAEIPDEIERTNYELQQEEEAIISYKELMEKKDSIQTVDEEEAIISIEELMNRGTQQKETNEEEQKLYNLTEEEANDNFIKELKQFRNDL